MPADDPIILNPPKQPKRQPAPKTAPAKKDKPKK